MIWGFPQVVQRLRITCQCRGHRFSPWSKKIPHAMGQPSPCAPTTEHMCRRARALEREKPVQREAHAPQPEHSPHQTQRERALVQQRKPGTAKTLKGK